MKKVKIDHSFEMLAGKRKTSTETTSSQCKSSKNPGAVQVDKLEDTEGNPLLQCRPGVEASMWHSSHPLWPESPLSVLTVVGDWGLRFSVTLLKHMGCVELEGRKAE